MSNPNSAAAAAAAAVNSAAGGGLRPVRAPTPSPAASLQPESPGMFFAAAHARRRIAIAVDLSDESAHAVRWAVAHYLRPGDAVVLLHVRPTHDLYGADWGALSDSEADASTIATEDELDAFTAAKADILATPLKDAGVPFKIHIVKDHDMKERLCLEVERLGLAAVIMGSKGFGAARRGGMGGRLGSVSDYCVHHCVCPVVVVRYPEGGEAGTANGGLSTGIVPPAVEDGTSVRKKDVTAAAADLHPVPEEEGEDRDPETERKDA